MVSSRVISGASLFLQAALLVVVVLLLRQNFAYRALLAQPTVSVPQPGERVDSFVSPALVGSVEVLFGKQEERRTVLLFLSPDCRYCDAQMPYWRELVDHADRERFRIVSVVRDSENSDEVQRYLAEGGIATLPTAFASAELRASLKLSSTPLTLVIDAEGIVERTWLGVWDPQADRSVRSYFGFRHDEHQP